ncbi:MAG TPA: hypothetical protein VN688_04570 [Gemmataceae bacterium]|nr:hypothetical protein [Gemmataceae bacterium]
MKAIPARQTAIASLARTGRRQQGAQFLRFQFAAVVAAVGLAIAALQVRQRVGACPMVPDQPTGECLDVRQVLIRRLDARASGEPLLQRLDGGAGKAPGLALPHGGQALTANRRADGGGLDAQQAGRLAWREPFHARGQRR